MSEPLRIRNFTSIPLTLKIVERFESPVPAAPTDGNLASNLTHFGRNVTSLVSNVTGGAITDPLHRKLADNAQSFATQEVGIRVEPFANTGTDIKPTDRGPNDIMRLTFEIEGQRYKIDAPTPTSESTAFIPLGDSQKSFTGVYIPQSSFLAVYSSSNLNSWMSHLNDSTPLAALSIPGTHNSPTHHNALPSVRCQAVSITDQLNNGIRFFDVRVQPEFPDDPSKDNLILVHGVFPISLTGNKYFRDYVLNPTVDFLRANPTETVILSLKREGPGQATDQQLSTILSTHYTADQSLWHTDPTLPSLGQARGKIVLLRRFALADPVRQSNHEGRGYGVDAENWAYNTANDRHGDVCVQDFCEVLETENIDTKIRYACEHLERAGGEVVQVQAEGQQQMPLYLNFLSASNFWKVGCWPDRIAKKLNPAVVRHLCERHDADGRGDGGSGVVVCDWVGDGGDWDLVRCIVGMNARLESKYPR